MKKIFTISDIISEQSQTGIVMHRIQICKPVVGSGLDTPVQDGPILNGVGQIGTGLGYLRTYVIDSRQRRDIS